MKQTLLLVLSFVCYCTYAQQRIPLYEAAIPNSNPIVNKEHEKPNELVDTLTFNVSEPSLTLFLPPKEKANGTAVIICPGGGYGVLLTKREGSDVARTFNELGIAAFVLRYRLPDDQVLPDRSIGPLQDAQQAIKTVRERANEWGVHADKIGIMGFSAGGHLAATAGTHFDDPKIENPKQTSLRPDFMLLINAVISFTDAIGHTGSRDNLLGKDASEAAIQYFSNELHVNATTPPSFLVHAGPDEVVPVTNSLAFFGALKENGVPVGLHIYAKGEHGFLTAPSFEEWFGRCVFWMDTMSFLQ